MDYTVLSAELSADPLGHGYAAMHDEEAAERLNTADRTVTRSRRITVRDLMGELGPTEAAAIVAATETAASSNAALVPESHIVFGGSDANRTVTITPNANLTGTVTITITVDDGTDATSDRFALRVVAEREPPFRIYLPMVIRQNW